MHCIDNLTYHHHKNSPPFFENLSLFLEPGKLHALHGKNGVGKSVLLDLLAGHTDPQAILKGTIEAPGAVLVNQRFDQMIADRFTFEENLQFASLARFPSPFNRLKRPQQFESLMKDFHLNYETPVHKLSGGQRQILALLMVLQRNPPLLLLDEPTAALDTHNAEMVFEFLALLQETTLLVVCHDRELIERFANGSHFTLEMTPMGTRSIRK